MPIIEILFNNTFYLYRVKRTDDGQGGWLETTQLVGTFKGRISPVSGIPKLVARSEEVHFSHRIYTDADEDVRKGDIVTLRTLVLEVISVHEPSMMQHHLEIDCRERQEEGALTV
jgi:SPP1 family predicted phage head-tail adaptor